MYFSFNLGWKENLKVFWKSWKIEILCTWLESCRYPDPNKFEQRKTNFIKTCYSNHTFNLIRISQPCDSNHKLHLIQIRHICFTSASFDSNKTLHSTQVKHFFTFLCLAPNWLELDHFSHFSVWLCPNWLESEFVLD